MTIQSQSVLSSLTTPAIAQVLVERYGSLSEMAKVPVEELQSIPGIGPRKAWQLQSAFELARLLSQEVALEQPIVDSPDKVAALFREEARVATVEVLYVVLQNTRMRLMKIVPVSYGTINSIHVDHRSVFRPAITANAHSITLVHFHPSGVPDPSDADVKVTRDLVRAGQLLHIKIMDHVIIGRASTERPKDYASLRELGFLFDLKS